MSGSKRRLLALGVAATVLAGSLLGWTIGLIDSDFVQRPESAVFLALVLLCLAALVGFLIELKRINGDST